MSMYDAELHAATEDIAARGHRGLRGQGHVDTTTGGDGMVVEVSRAGESEHTGQRGHNMVNTGPQVFGHRTNIESVSREIKVEQMRSPDDDDQELVDGVNEEEDVGQGEAEEEMGNMRVDAKGIAQRGIQPRQHDDDGLTASNHLTTGDHSLVHVTTDHNGMVYVRTSSGMVEDCGGGRGDVVAVGGGGVVDVVGVASSSTSAASRSATATQVTDDLVASLVNSSEHERNSIDADMLNRVLRAQVERAGPIAIELDPQHPQDQEEVEEEDDSFPTTGHTQKPQRRRNAATTVSRGGAGGVSYGTGRLPQPLRFHDNRLHYHQHHLARSGKRAATTAATAIMQDHHVDLRLDDHNLIGDQLVEIECDSGEISLMDMDGVVN